MAEAALARSIEARPDSGPATDQIEAFQALGHVLLRAALPTRSVAGAAPALRAFIHEHQGVPDPFGARDGDVREVFTWLDAPEPVARFVASSRLGEIAAALLGVNAVRLWNFRGFFKAAGGAGTPWHQDQTYVPLDTASILTLWIPLSPVESDMGPLLYAEGSHRAGQLAPAAMASVWPTARDEPMAVGDVAAHFGWTLHASEPNASARTREAVAVCLFADGARLKGPISAFLTKVLRPILGGSPPGTPIAGPATPLVFRKGDPS